MYSIFYKLLPIKKSIADGDIHLLNDLEIKSIKKTEKVAILYSAIIGGIMVVALYAPQYKYVSFFSAREFIVPLLDYKINISFTSFIYGYLLVFVEVVFLTMLNIYCAHEIALSTGFIDVRNKSSKEKKQFLLNISHQKKNKEIHKLGIDPYLGLGKSAVFFLNLLFSLKATLSNYFVRNIFQRLLGRYAFRMVLDLLGIPVFAFWNAMGTAKVLKESRIVFMGVNYLQQFEIELSKFRALSELEKSILYDSLQYISICKRDYHQNHYVLSKIIIDNFSITTESVHLISKDYEINLKSCENDFKKLNEKILILGIVLDGVVSYRERNRIKRLNTSGVLTLRFSEIKEIANGFVYGKGIEF
jgi:hypothetical protein